MRKKKKKKQRGKVEGKKIKNKFKVNKLILYIIFNSFYLFNSSA